MASSTHVSAARCTFHLLLSAVDFNMKFISNCVVILCSMNHKIAPHLPQAFRAFGSSSMLDPGIGPPLLRVIPGILFCDAMTPESVCECKSGTIARAFAIYQVVWVRAGIALIHIRKVAAGARCICGFSFALRASVPVFTGMNAGL